MRMGEASAIVRSWFENLPVVVVPSPERRYRQVLERAAEDKGTRGRGWSDAYRAALTMEMGAGLATLDRDFRKSAGLRLGDL